MLNHITVMAEKPPPVRDDNRIENLALMTFHAHAALHMLERTNERMKKYELK